jgi:hypothetical protein
MNLDLFGIVYAVGAVSTLLYLLQVGRPGLKRRVLQMGASCVWPAYWLLVQGPRSSIIAVGHVLAFIVLGVLLVALLPLVALERRHLI